VILTAKTSSRCSSLSPVFSRGQPGLMTSLPSRQSISPAFRYRLRSYLWRPRPGECRATCDGLTKQDRVKGAPDPATRHPVTERSEVEVPRSDIVFWLIKIPTGREATIIRDDGTRSRPQAVAVPRTGRDPLTLTRREGPRRRPEAGSGPSRRATAGFILYNYTLRCNVIHFHTMHGAALKLHPLISYVVK
jgi:hypothetical protein